MNAPTKIITPEDLYTKAVNDTARYWLNEFSNDRIKAIKKVREVHKLSLRESKEIVDEILRTEVLNKIELGEFERHYILYCKWHYTVTDRPIEGLRYIHSIICGMDIEYVHDGYIWEKLIQILNKYVSPSERLRWMEEIPKASSIMRGSYLENIYARDLVTMTIAYIGNMRCVQRHDNQIMELGESDFEKFPKLEKEKGE